MTNAERTYTAAFEVFSERYSRMDGDFVITELLENGMHFDGHDYTDYLPEGFTPDYAGALEILNDVEVIE